MPELRLVGVFWSFTMSVSTPHVAKTTQRHVLFPQLLEPCPTLPFENMPLCQNNRCCWDFLGF